ncbi:hypothetical protein C1645_818748 [Glomus cerebriforme]|uniref:Uncharacterized protein n=1 Tax=Glomus cerebriforme TaxID=658196 RepID=A0A397T983_9GLOM|nr:hypothetical protein C1645_818748 [Glomus cerebriforme]
MPYKHQGAKFSEASNQRYHKLDKKHIIRGAKGAVYARGLRRSKCVIEYSCKTYAREDKNEDENKEEEVLNSSYQSTFTILQPSST